MTPTALLKTIGLCTGIFLGHLHAADAPPPAKLLPQDTLAVFSAPSWADMRKAVNASPTTAFWHDPALKPLREKFIRKLQDEVIGPMERELGIKFSDYKELVPGQVTFALTQSGWSGGEKELPGWLLILDAKGKKEELGKILGDVKKRWVESGKQVKPQKIRNLDFSTLILTPEQAAKTFKRPGADNNQRDEPAESAGDQKKKQNFEVTLGQSDSLFILGNKVAELEKVLLRQSGGAAPALAEQAVFQANYNALFRKALGFVWINAGPLIDIALKKIPAPTPAESAEGGPPPPARIFEALGLKSLKAVAVAYEEAPEGPSLNLFLGVPEAGRKGLFAMLFPEKKDAGPPAFIPADAIKFNRYRLDGKKFWAGLEKLIAEVSPEFSAMFQMMMKNAGKDKDPNFDLKTAVINNLGDDIMSFEKPPRSLKLADIATPPAVFLLGSPQPEQLVAGLANAAGSFPGGGKVEQREFLGRKIYSLGPRAPQPSAENPPRGMNFAAGSGYVAFSSDNAALEEFLRTSESKGKTLRETPGLADAAQKVGGMNNGLFMFENQKETLRAIWTSIQQNPSALDQMLPFLPMSKQSDGQTNRLKEWVDYSQLPPFDRVAKYFHFTVGSGAASVDGWLLRTFFPISPQLKR